MKILNKIFVRIVLMLIYFYQYILSPLKYVFFGLNSGCRFYPCCSEYGKMAFKQHGFFKGFYLIFYRIFRCHPFNEGGYDPVPSSQKQTQIFKLISKD